MNIFKNELENLVDLFSNFYQTIIINEPDNEKLKGNLQLFLSTFEQNDINFSKSHDFLKQFKQGTITNLNNDAKNQELLPKFQPQPIVTPKKISDFENFTKDDYNECSNEIMNEMLNLDSKFRVKDVILNKNNKH